MPTDSTTPNRRLLVGSIAVAVVAVLLGIVVGFATEVVGVLVNEQWVRANLGLVLAGFGAVVVVCLLVAAIQARHALAAPPAPEPQEQTHQEPGRSTTVRDRQVPPPPSEVAARSNLPPRNPDFTGRGEPLDRLWKDLASGPAAVVAAHGLGGVGKTQLALEYAHRRRDRGDYQLVWWVSAETPLAIAASLSQLAPVLGVAVEADQEATVASVLHELGRRQRWLLVFDNAEDPQQLRRYLPSGRGGHVLVTSRNPAWGGVARPIDIDVLPLPEAVELLTSSSGDPDQHAASKVAEALGRLPLALAQAAGYIQQTPGLGLARYLDRFQQAHAKLLAEGKPVGYPATVASTWRLNLDQLASDAPAAVALLRLCAFLAPETPVPLDLFTTTDPEHLSEELAAVAADPLALDSATAALYRYSLVSPAQGGVRVHRLVQAVTRDQLPQPQAAEAAIQAAELLLTAFPSPAEDPRGWPRAALLLPHVLAAADHAERWPAAHQATAGLFNQAGAYLWSRAELHAARQAHERALRILDAAYGPDHPQVAGTLGNLAIVLRGLGELPAARQAHERALRLKEAAHGPDHPEVAITLTNLSVVLMDLGELPAARQTLERALGIFETAYGPDHPHVAVTVGNLGIVLRGLGELPAARQTLERALRLKEAAYGPDHPEVARTLTNLGIVLRGLGELPAARQTLERALRLKEAAHGPDHPQVAITLANLGLVLRDLGELSAAHHTLERAVGIFEAVYGSDHPYTRQAQQNWDSLMGR